MGQVSELKATVPPAAKTSLNLDGLGMWFVTLVSENVTTRKILGYFTSPIRAGAELMKTPANSKFKYAVIEKIPIGNEMVSYTRYYFVTDDGDSHWVELPGPFDVQADALARTYAAIDCD